MTVKCSTCRYYKRSKLEEPCKNCHIYSRWDPIEPRIACGTCQYEDVLVSDEPCNSCIFEHAGRAMWKPNKEEEDRMNVSHEDKYHYNCRYYNTSKLVEPCKTCHDYSLWEPEVPTDSGLADSGLADSGLADSGIRVTYEGGGQREPKDTYFHLIPMSGLMALAKHYYQGSEKYSKRNWEKGIPWSGCVDAIFRHLIKYMEQGNRDENHLAAIAWNAFALIEYQETHPEMNDLKWGEDK